MKRSFPELEELEILRSKKTPYGSHRLEAEIHHSGEIFPIYSFSFGVEDRSLPTVAFFGGVHGLERIGTRLLIAYLQSLHQLLSWDRVTKELLKVCRVHFYPLVNPVGMYLNSRSNGDGIDLMRNAPVEAPNRSKYQLFAGHRISPRLPWYRGPEGQPMAAEAQAVVDFVKRELWGAKVAQSLDVHSGFGSRDRLWFPYARSSEEFGNAPEAMSLKALLDETYPNHIYKVEPQSHQYTAHGDLWDYLYDEYRTEKRPGIFIPWSLEMGSWIWVKKNPKQLFSRAGVFNPMLPHRRQRVLRRHVTLFDFLIRAVISNANWAFLPPQKREQLWVQAKKEWYGGE
ncbi:MAG: zinc carboxypeptidase [Bdellovibrionales bacterium]|nr:zinc carboxypeptidase [Bdellovibrionales bacterium]